MVINRKQDKRREDSILIGIRVKKEKTVQHEMKKMSGIIYKSKSFNLVERLSDEYRLEKANEIRNL